MKNAFGIIALLILFTLNANAQMLVPGSVKLIEAKGAGDKPIYVLQISGAIATPMAAEIEEQLKKAVEDRPLLVHLNSEGGSVTEGEKIIAILQRLRAEKKTVHTTVMNGEKCASMCVFLYAQGEKRFASEVSTFMFHGAIQFAITNVPDAWKTREQLQHLIKAGVSTAWLNSLWEAGAFTKPGAYWMSGKDLVDAKSGLVTDLLSRHDVQEPWRAPFDPNIRPR